MHRDAEILFANEAFYLAFATRDLAAMDALWARDARVTCVHPGWEALHGRDAVMESWGNILGHSSAPKVQCREARVSNYGSVAQVLCFEVLQTGVLMAANLFIQEEQCPVKWCPKGSRGFRRRERSDRSLRARGLDGSEVVIACLR
jgi:hypothetical protein